jgi:hypothetical protein
MVHGHLSYPHVMFFAPASDGGEWAADVKGSPVLSGALTGQITLFFSPVRKWSDGASPTTIRRRRATTTIT